MVTLPIFWNTEESVQSEEMGLEFPLSESAIKNVTFINIDAFCHYKEDDIDCSKIFAGGTVFICALTETELISKLKPILK